MWNITPGSSTLVSLSHENRSGEDCRSSGLADAFKQTGGAILH
jgi:hypothetical protein